MEEWTRLAVASGTGSAIILGERCGIVNAAEGTQEAFENPVQGSLNPAFLLRGTDMSTLADWPQVRRRLLWVGPAFLAALVLAAVGTTNLMRPRMVPNDPRVQA